jgi:predicted transcriptional regulator
MNMKNENYYVIHGWMINKLKLKNKELLVYAIIYGFSQAQGNKYTGSVKYLSSCVGVSRCTMTRILKSLCDKGLIIKEQKEVNKVLFNEYAAVIPDDTTNKNDSDETIVCDDLSEMLNKIKDI